MLVTKTLHVIIYITHKFCPQYNKYMVVGEAWIGHVDMRVWGDYSAPV